MAIPTTPNERQDPTTPTLRVHLRHTVGGQTDVLPGFYLGYSSSVPPTATQLNTYATAIAAQWVAHLAPLCYQNYILTEVTVSDISTNTGAGGVAVVSDLGTRVGAMLPAGTSTNINFAIARRYRGGKPRIYLPYGTDQDLQTPQTWTGAYTTQVTSAWNAFITGVAGAAWSGASNVVQVNVPWYDGVWQGTDSKGRVIYRPNYRNPMIANDLIIGVSAPVKIGSQRRRNATGG